MREQLTQYVDLLFAGAADCEDIKQEILQNTLDRFDDLVSQGKAEEAVKAFEEASIYKAAVSELSMFRALALRKLMRFSEAQTVLQEMLESGTNLLVNKDLRSYYGVGSPTPMPFEYDIEKKNVVEGQILRAYALLGLGKKEAANQALAAAEALDPFNFRIYAYREVYPTV